jgi:hypothetical protein
MGEIEMKKRVKIVFVFIIFMFLILSYLSAKSIGIQWNIFFVTK